ncbi:MAG: toll/interleukin-1 receptor domain-containing protein [Bacteroidota bacterium]
MALANHVKILQAGVLHWNKWRSENPDTIPQLSKIDFGEILDIRTDYSSLNLNGAYIESSSFFAVSMDNVNFKDAILQNCNCYGASFNNSNFESADLQLANFTLASLNSANLDKSYLGNTVFACCDLSTTKGLETCNHLHSSILDHTTLAESNNLPLIFLQGCGLPDLLIDNISVLKESPINYNSCFISHSSYDAEFVKKLYTDLQGQGVRCWFAPKDLIGGSKSFTQITEAIHMHEKLLVILSKKSMSSSWVATEIKKAVIREREEKRKILFPISLVPIKDIKNWELFDADSGLDLAAEIRSYHILNFEKWKSDDNYLQGFKKLVHALKSNKEN